LNVYPNPFTVEARIAGAAGCALRVMDAAGATVYAMAITEARQIINMEHLPEGVYFFTLKKLEKRKSSKQPRIINN